MEKGGGGGGVLFLALFLGEKQSAGRKDLLKIENVFIENGMFSTVVLKH